MDDYVVTLPSGSVMPRLIFGTYAPNEADELLIAAVNAAIRAGFRHIDGAAHYYNERVVGQGIKSVLDENVVKREDLFVTSKLWNTCHSPKMAKIALKKTLEELGLEYLDLYLLHYPMGFEEGGKFEPLDENGKLKFSDADYIDTWKALEECVDEGLIKNIGASNFNAEQLKRLIDHTRIKPACNQVEIHPYFINSELVEFCKGVGVLPVAFSPFGGIFQGSAPILKDPVLLELSERKNKPLSQIILRWLLQRGCGVAVKSTKPERIQQNVDIFGFELSDSEVSEIESVNKNHRYDSVLPCVGHKYYPF